MNEKNAEYLENQLVYTGFNEIPKDQFRDLLSAGKETFNMQVQKKYGDDEAKATLNFKLSDQGNYFFNSFDLLVKKQGVEEELKQNFRIRFGNTFTFKEAFNMMMGRSVNKDFIKVDRDNKENNQSYNAWAYLDQNDKDSKGNMKIVKINSFDLLNKLAEYPIKELGNEKYKNELIDSLARGNRQSVTFSNEKDDTKFYIEANPKFKTINIYDEQLKKVNLSLKIQPNEAQSQGQNKRQGKRSAQNESEDNGPDEKKNRKRNRQRIT